MSKKRTGLWIAFGAVLGAAAAGISYYLKYKSFNDELEQDFHDYEEEEDAKEEKNSGAVSCGESGRSYIQSEEISGSCGGDEKKDVSKEAEIKAEEAGMDAPEEREANAEVNAPEEHKTNAEANAAEEQEANAGTNAADPREKESKKETASHVTVEEDTEGADA